LDLVGSASRAAPFELCHEGHAQASITCDDHSLLDTLKTICPLIEQKVESPVKRASGRVFALIAALAAMIVMLVLSVKFLAAPIAQIVPTAWEKNLGNQIAKRLVEDTGICSATPGVRALERLVNRMISVVGIGYPIHVQITDDARLDSFAVSGGSIVVYRGLLDSANSSEEFAGIIAHEIAHTAERHPLEGMLRSLGASFLVSSDVEDLPALALSTTAFKDQMVKLSYTSENEAVASKLATEILTAAAISPLGHQTFFSRMKGGDAAGQAFAARHPEAGMKLGELKGPAAGTGAALSKDDWAALKSICAQKISLRRS
jgi:predicted Zn-dependent protease